MLAEYSTSLCFYTYRSRRVQAIPGNTVFAKLDVQTGRVRGNALWAKIRVVYLHHVVSFACTAPSACRHVRFWHQSGSISSWCRKFEPRSIMYYWHHLKFVQSYQRKTIPWMRKRVQIKFDSTYDLWRFTGNRLDYRTVSADCTVV